MSVASEINRIKSNISAAYTEAEAKGATIPATVNSANLADTVASIPTGRTPTLQSKTVTPTTSQQSVTPDSGYDGLSDVTVNATPLEAKTVTPTSQQQVVTPTAPNIGLSSVTVGAATQPTLITKQITENGTYTAADDNSDGYSEVTVEVPDKSKAVLDSLIDRSITSIVVDTSEIGRSAFAYCSNLISVTTTNAIAIRQAAFDSCNNLIEANINDDVAVFEQYAFRNCRLRYFIMPKKASVLKLRAFHNNHGLSYIDMSNVESIPKIDTNAFGINSFPFLFKDQAQLEAYASATNWSALADRFQIKGATS